VLAVLHEAAGAELEVVADRGGGGGDLAELAALDVGHVAQQRASLTTT
jgi:hypothetical protein